MATPACYYDAIRMVQESERAVLEAFRARHDAALVPHRDPVDLAAFEADGTPMAAVRFCLDVEACLCGLAVSPLRMRSALPYRLVRAWYSLALARGASHAHAHSHANYEGLLQRLGFRAVASRPGTLRLGLHDIGHLRGIGSPLAAVYEHWRAAGSPAD